MKYMGSKNSMLKNGLGELLLEQCAKTYHFFDLFSGSAAVSRYVSENTYSKVYSSDLQTYSYFLSQAIIGRNNILSERGVKALKKWIDYAKRYKNTFTNQLDFKGTQKFVFENRKLSKQSESSLIRAYGGYYFSFEQILILNYLMKNLPKDDPVRTIAMAALIESASYCAASPGHTAQPFQPKGNGLIAIIDAWKKDPINQIEKRVEELANRHAKVIGESFTENSINLIDKINEGDLVFLDPPYSGVHYSRFYHVLESISRKSIGKVSGRGRYPAPQERPKSDYSLKTKSQSSLNNLLENISAKKAKAIITFPNGECSNGLSGTIVKEIADKHFKVTKELIKGRFSTLGGNNKNRPARHLSEELVLLLEPK